MKNHAKTLGAGAALMSLALTGCSSSDNTTTAKTKSNVTQSSQTSASSSTSAPQPSPTETDPTLLPAGPFRISNVTEDNANDACAKVLGSDPTKLLPNSGLNKYIGEPRASQHTWGVNSVGTGTYSYGVLECELQYGSTSFSNANNITIYIGTDEDVNREAEDNLTSTDGIPVPRNKAKAAGLTVLTYDAIAADVNDRAGQAKAKNDHTEPLLPYVPALTKITTARDVMLTNKAVSGINSMK